MSTPVELDELVITVIVDNETDNLSSIPPGVPKLPEVVGLLGRIPPTRTYAGHDCVAVFDHLCTACHGLSVLLTGTRDSERHTMLFDVGPYADVWLANARRLDVDLAAIEAVVLSHWHWDHSGALTTVLAEIAAARAAAGLDAPVVADLHPDRPHQRGVRMPSGTVVMLPPEPTLADIRHAGSTVELRPDAHVVANPVTAPGGERMPRWRNASIRAASSRRPWARATTSVRPDRSVGELTDQVLDHTAPWRMFRDTILVTWRSTAPLASTALSTTTSSTRSSTHSRSGNRTTARCCTSVLAERGTCSRSSRSRETTGRRS